MASQSQIRYVFSKLSFMKTDFSIHVVAVYFRVLIALQSDPMFIFISFLCENISFCELFQISSILKARWLTPTSIEP